MFEQSKMTKRQRLLTLHEHGIYHHLYQSQSKISCLTTWKNITHVKQCYTAPMIPYDILLHKKTNKLTTIIFKTNKQEIFWNIS